MAHTTFEPVTVPDVSDKDASQLVALAREKATAMGVPVVVCVYSVRDRIKQLAWMDGAPQRSGDIATMKAKTSMLVGKPTRGLQEGVQPGKPLHSIDRSNGGMMVVAGGYPIEHEGQLIGGIGISGGTPDQDCQIAEFALGIGN